MESPNKINQQYYIHFFGHSRIPFHFNFHFYFHSIRKIIQKQKYTLFTRERSNYMETVFKHSESNYEIELFIIRGTERRFIETI